MRLFSAAISYVAFAVLAPFLLLHRKLRAGRRQRFGHYPPTFLRQPTQAPIWLHGASAGDVVALLPTARALRRALPDVPLVASTLTDSGYHMALQHRDVFAEVIYCPWDLPHVVRRAMRRVRPCLLVLEYTELWPQLMAAARAQDAAVVLHNGRLGAARLGRYRLLFALVGNLLQQLDLCLMRDARERSRAVALGAAAENVLVTGNTKFDNVGAEPPDAAVAALRAASGFAADAPIWVAGSTHEGEEETLLAIHVALRAQVPALKLVVAPRYPARAGRVVAAAQRLGLRCRLRHPGAPGAGKGADADAGPCDVFVLNSLGELPAAYALATAVFVGGSFVARGGQNILEPAACGKPVLFGPHMDNFADSVAVLLGRGGVQVKTPAQLQQVLQDWLRAPARCQALGALAQAQVRTVRGAAARNAAHLVRLRAARAAHAEGA